MKKYLSILLSIIVALNINNSSLLLSVAKDIDFTPSSQIQVLDFESEVTVDISSDGIVTFSNLPKIVNSDSTQSSSEDKWVYLLKADTKALKNTKSMDTNLWDEVVNKNTQYPTLLSSSNSKKSIYETDKNFVLKEGLDGGDASFNLKNLPYQNLKYFYIAIANYKKDVTVSSDTSDTKVTGYFYYAVSKNTYELPIKVNYDLNGGSEVVVKNNQDKTYEYIKKTGTLSAETPVYAGYKFLGWYDKKEQGSTVSDISKVYDEFEFDSDNPKFETTIYANWQEKSTGAWTTNPTISSYTYGSNPSIPSYESNIANAAYTVRYTGTTSKGSKYDSSNLPTQAGSYVMKVTASETDDYKELTSEVSFKVNKKEVTLSWSKLTQNYTGSALLPTVTLGGIVNGDSCNATLTVAGGEAVNVGKYTVTATSLSNSNYKLPSDNSTSFRIIKSKSAGSVTKKSKSTSNKKSTLKVRKGKRSTKKSSSSKKSTGKSTSKNKAKSSSSSSDTTDSNSSSNKSLDSNSKTTKYTASADNRGVIGEIAYLIFGNSNEISKSITVTILVVIILLLIGLMYFLLFAKNKKIRIKFDTNGGDIIKETKIKKKSNITRPEDPVRNGYIFDGWYEDENCTIPFDFDKKLKKDTTIYANWN